MTDIKFACSLGTTCSSAELLKRIGWRVCAYPFDWVFSNLEIISHCIETDFSLLLDKSQYVDIQVKWNSDQCGHKTYEPNMFNHRDMRKEENYAYLMRSVDRIRYMFKSKEPKLFVLHFKNNETSMSDSFHTQLLKFESLIKKYTDAFNIVVIWNISKAQDRHHEVVKNGSINIITLWSKSEDDGMHFLDDQDNQYIDQIIKSLYRFVG